MGVTVEELEQLQGQPVIDAEVFEDDDEENLLYNDLRLALDLLKRSITMLDYVSDPTFCKTLSKREREAMLRLSTQIDEFVDGVEETISEE